MKKIYADKINFVQKVRKLPFNTTHGAIIVYLQNNNVQRQTYIKLIGHSQ